MKYFILILSLSFLVACNQHDSRGKNSTPVVPPPSNNTVKQKNISKPTASDSQLLNISEDILLAIREKNFKKIADFVHPRTGVRFSPYAYIDTSTAKILSRAQLIQYGPTGVKFTWGILDAREEPIVASIRDYFNNYVYPLDFLNAPQKSVNRFLGSGNSLNNLKEIYPGSDFTEFYFPGIDPKYEGMDWETLRLVFKKENNQYYLVAIVHDEWTI